MFNIMLYSVNTIHTSMHTLYESYFRRARDNFLSSSIHTVYDTIILTIDNMILIIRLNTYIMCINV